MRAGDGLGSSLRRDPPASEMMAVRRWILLGVMLSACNRLAPPRIDAWAAANADFARFRTYDWTSSDIPARRAHDPVADLDRRVRAAVDAELAAKGFARRVSAEPADFLVGYDVNVAEKHTETFQDIVRYRAAGGTKELGESFAEGYHEGTLVLEITDESTRQLAWRASTRAILDEDDAHRRVEEAVHAMLARFPRP